MTLSNAEILAAVEDWLLRGHPSAGARELAAQVAGSTLPAPGRAALVRMLLLAGRDRIRFPDDPAGPLRWLACEFPARDSRKKIPVCSRKCRSPQLTRGCA
jgi:hypothetical protein